VRDLDRWLVDAARELPRTRRDRAAQLNARLDALSPLGALRRGYSVALSEDGHVLRSTVDFVGKRPFRLRVSDGSVECRSEHIEPDDPEVGR
jgi:exodeoxyribonuclease VII large subunit